MGAVIDVKSITIYVFSFGLSLFFAALIQIFQVQIGKQQRPFFLFYWISLLIPVFLAGLRWNVGTDYYNYQEIYHMVNSFTKFEDFAAQSGQTEWGYMLLNVICYRIFNNEQMVFFLSSLMIYSMFFCGLRLEQESHSILFSLYIFYMCFFFQSMNIIRQYIAMGILFLIQKYIWERKPVKFLIGVIVAMLFHNTSIIFLPFYFTYGNSRYVKWMRYGILVGLCGALVVLAADRSLVDLLMKFLGEEPLEISGGSIGFGVLLKRLPILLIILWRYDSIIKKDPRCKLWLLFYLVAVILYQFGYFSLVFNRTALFFETSILHILPIAIQSIPRKKERILVGLAIILYLGVWFYQDMVVENIGNCLPYQWRLTE